MGEMLLPHLLHVNNLFDTKEKKGRVKNGEEKEEEEGRREEAEGEEPV